jgi:HEAT repeat protein
MAPLPFVAECLTDSDDLVRGAATYTLEQIGTKDARTVLWRATGNSSTFRG